MLPANRRLIDDWRGIHSNEAQTDRTRSEIRNRSVPCQDYRFRGRTGIINDWRLRNNDLAQAIARNGYSVCCINRREHLHKKQLTANIPLHRLKF